MGQAKTRELRREPRHSLHGRVVGTLFLRSSGQVLNYLCINISSGGLGIESEDIIVPEIEVVLQLDEVEVSLEVVWGMRTGPSQVMRYGLKVVSSDHDLLVLCPNWSYQD